MLPYIGLGSSLASSTAQAELLSAAAMESPTAVADPMHLDDEHRVRTRSPSMDRRRSDDRNAPAARSPPRNGGGRYRSRSRGRSVSRTPSRSRSRTRSRSPRSRTHSLSRDRSYSRSRSRSRSRSPEAKSTKAS